MKHSNKMLKTLSVEELENALKDLKIEEETLFRKKQVSLFNHIVETEIVNKRFNKDLCIFLAGIINFQLSVFVYFNNVEPRWLGTALVGTSMMASIAVPLILHRTGCKRLMDKHYEEVRQHFINNPEEYRKKVEECRIVLEEDEKIVKITKEKEKIEKYLQIKKEDRANMVRV